MLSFSPLADLSTDGNRAWASEWIEMLVALQGVTITPDYRNAISKQLALMAKSCGRSLSDFVSGVQMREIKDALHHYSVDGSMGQLLDAEEDGLALGPFQCFAIEELMNMGKRNLVPVLTYLFRRIEKRLTGAPSLIILDEAWLMLGHPVNFGCGTLRHHRRVEGILPDQDLPAEWFCTRARYARVLRAHRLQ